jgi:nitrite reductase (NADH) large subunit
MKVVIVGNGIAGIMVAARLRQLEPDLGKLQVEIYTREPYEYYSRIRLPEAIESLLAAEDLSIYKPAWYADRHIQVYRNQEVVRIVRQARIIVLRGGATVGYDRLALCTGADSFRPPLPNVGLEGVFTIREYGDAEAIRSYLRSGARHAVVLGGGLLGLEAARHLCVPQLEDLTIIEIAPRLLPKQLDGPGARLLQRTVEGFPARVILGAEVTAFLGERRVHAVRLRDGRELPADLVLISTGIRPRTALAQEAGLTVKRGVVVSEYLQSEDPDIFVAGDLTEFQGIVWGIIPAALDHAPVVAHNLLHDRSRIYSQTIPQNTLKVAGVQLTSKGKVVIEPNEEAEYRALARLDEAGGRYEKYVLRDGVLVGCILLASRDNLPFADERLGTVVSEDEIRALPW